MVKEVALYLCGYVTSVEGVSEYSQESKDTTPSPGTSSPGSWQHEQPTWRVRRGGHRGGTPARRSHSQEPGHGRVGPSGSEATRWHHYDGAREIPLGAVSGDDGNGHEHDAVSRPHRREGYTLTPEKRPGPVLRS